MEDFADDLAAFLDDGGAFLDDGAHALEGDLLGADLLGGDGGEHVDVHAADLTPSEIDVAGHTPEADPLVAPTATDVGDPDADADPWSAAYLD